MKKLSLVFLLFIFLFPLNISASSLAGRILLQVEKNGEAYYYHPAKLELLYLARPSDAFVIMREQGIGISNSNLLKIPVADSSAFKSVFEKMDSDSDLYSDYTELVSDYNPYGEGKITYDLAFTKKNAGKIFLQVEEQGEAWYINPLDLKRYYLGRPSDAFEIMRTLGLGISNLDLKNLGLEEVIIKKYAWRYDNQDHYLNYPLSEELLGLYQQRPKVLSYYQDEVPKDLRAAYYQLFFEREEKDYYTLGLLEKLRSMAYDNNYSSDKELEYIIAFIQFLDYDLAKSQEDSPVANFPYETLYLQSGVCTDTSFLAYLYAKELGYGVAILDFKESNHAALGIKCPVDISLDQSGYCFVESTSYFPLGMVPSSLNNGQASLKGEILNLFSADNLGSMEIRLAIDGKEYQGVESNMAIASDLQSKQGRIKELKELIDDESISNKEAIINEHNDLVFSYNELLASFYQITSE